MNEPAPGFSFDADPVRPELVAALDRAWTEIAGPGTWWNGEERVGIATLARRAFAGDDVAEPELPTAAREAARVIAADPATPSETWVADVVRELGELRYVELIGIVARVVSIDTLCRLLGRHAPELPAPRPGSPSHAPPPANARRQRTWVSMVVASPPKVLGAVPDAEAAMNDVTDALYMPEAQMADPDLRRGDLHRTQIELVAATVSHRNQCF